MKNSALILSAVAATTLAACATKTTTPDQPASAPSATGDAVMLEPSQSNAYQYALEQAFADLSKREGSRAPASVAESFGSSFRRTRKFEIYVYPKFMQMGAQPGAGRTQVKLDKPSKFLFELNRNAKCKMGLELVSEADRNGCVQVEIKPIESKIKGHQCVRLYMDADYRAFGLSYYEYDAEKEAFKEERKRMKWDPTQPLSAEILETPRALAPLDLPIHASNRMKETRTTIALTRGSRAGKTCEGWTYSYRNVYGANVKAQWCAGDPWPSVVETNGYVAVLESITN